MKVKKRQFKTYGIRQNSAKREIHSNTSLPQETRETSNNNLTSYLKQLDKEKKKKPKVKRRKEVIKMRSEINEKETKEAIGKVNKTKHWYFEK